MLLLLAAGPLTAGLAGCDRQSPPSGQANASGQAPATSGEATGAPDSAKDGFDYKLDRSKAGTPAPAIAFQDPQGQDVMLRDLAGRPMLVNLWATWCTPCVAEMPTLDRIAAEYGPRGLAVFTISQDTQVAAIKPFFEKHDLPHLKGWTDAENGLGFHYATGLLPTTILYDAQGREIVRVIGAMDWDGTEGRALLDAAMAS